MKSFVITIEHLKESESAAERCKSSMPEFDVQNYYGCTPKDDPVGIFDHNGMDATGFNQQSGREYSYVLSAMAAFLSHWGLWNKCIEDNEEYQIFEHDAVAISFIPEFIPYKHCISVGKPSYGNFKIAPRMGPRKLFSKTYFPGAHAYRLKPAGAKLLVEGAKTHAQPTDIFLNNKDFPTLEEYYPWLVEAKDSFSTIQRELGCRAKHNWHDGVGYTIIND